MTEAHTLYLLSSLQWMSTRHLKGTANVADFKTYIFPLLFFKRLPDVHNQEHVEHLQHVVRAYHDFKDEPGFTRMVLVEEIRAKAGNLSIPFYVGGETKAQTKAAAESATTALPDALVGWLKSLENLKATLGHLLYQTQ